MTPTYQAALRALAALSLELPERVYDDASKAILAALHERPRPHRDIRAVLHEMLLLVPVFPHVPVKEANDPGTEAWRANNFRSTFQKIAEEASYAPQEVQHHYWMRAGVSIREHFPDLLAMGVAGPDHVRIDGMMRKRNGLRVPDGSTDLWERAVMRVWMPEAFVVGEDGRPGRWHLVTESGADQ